MHVRNTIFIAAVTTAATLSIHASAATIVTAMAPLNIRSGPGPQYSVVGAIPDRGQAMVLGCIQGSLWCPGQLRTSARNWAYAQYMTAQLSGRSLVVGENLNAVPAKTYQAPVETMGSAPVPVAPVITGTLVERQDTAVPLVIAPPPAVGSYVVSHPVAPAYLNGEVVEGVGLPESVATAPVPGYDDYRYAYVNNVPVLVNPTTRRVEYLYR